MSIKLDIEWTPQGSPDRTQGSLAACYRHIVDTKPCNVSVRSQNGCVDRKTEKSRIEIEAEFRLKSLDNK